MTKVEQEDSKSAEQNKENLVACALMFPSFVMFSVLVLNIPDNCVGRSKREPGLAWNPVLCTALWLRRTGRDMFPTSSFFCYTGGQFLMVLYTVSFFSKINDPFVFHLQRGGIQKLFWCLYADIIFVAQCGLRIKSGHRDRHKHFIRKPIKYLKYIEWGPYFLYWYEES